MPQIAVQRRWRRSAPLRRSLAPLRRSAPFGAVRLRRSFAGAVWRRSLAPFKTNVSRYSPEGNQCKKCRASHRLLKMAGQARGDVRRRSDERLQLRMNVSRLRMNVSWRRSMPNVSRPGLEPLERGTPSPLSFHMCQACCHFVDTSPLALYIFNMHPPLSVLFKQCRASHCLGPALPS